ncbi:MAG: helix-turn-helix domain-containing protein [Pseudonocardiaceae bacterium]|nr:helix-turn-helix domain-containing protein [Pseudonocardiaceae bacterium]
MRLVGHRVQRLSVLRGATMPPSARAGIQTRNFDEAHWLAQRLMTRHRMDVVSDDQPFEARIDTDQCDGMGVMQFSFGAEVFVDSEPLEHFVTIHVPLAGRLRVEHRDQRVVAHQRQAAVFSCQGPMTLRWERGLQLLVLKIEQADLERRLRMLLSEPLRRPLVFDVAAPLDGTSGALAGVTDLVRRAFDAAGPAGPPAPVRAELKSMVVSALLLGHRHSYTDAVFAPRSLRAPRALRLAVELIEDGSPLTTAELARQVEVSERTLYEAFQRTFGLSPSAYSRQLRLERVRDELVRLSADDGETIAEVALRHGFNHPSRFATSYRNRFGELPSVTLRRTHPG